MDRLIFLEKDLAIKPYTEMFSDNITVFEKVQNKKTRNTNIKTVHSKVNTSIRN